MGRKVWYKNKIVGTIPVIPNSSMLNMPDNGNYVSVCLERWKSKETSTVALLWWSSRDGIVSSGGLSWERSSHSKDEFMKIAFAKFQELKRQHPIFGGEQ